MIRVKDFCPLAWFRDKGDIPRLGRGFGLPQSTAYRYLDEVIEVLAARAPGLQEQLERALAEGVPYLCMTWPPPGRMSGACCGRSWTPCPCWPIRVMKAQVTASTSR